MRRLITTLALSSPLFLSTSTAAGIAATAQEETSYPRDASELVVTVFHPRMDTNSIMRALDALETSSVDVSMKEPDGTRSENIRSRFTVIGRAILVQDFPEGNARAMALLERLDRDLSRPERSSDTPGASPARETLRLQRLDTMSAVQLIGSSYPLIKMGYSDGVPVLTLDGTADDLKNARALIEEADRPLPQFLMQWSLIEAVAPDDLGDGEAAPEALTKALSPLAPGKVFKKSGSFMVRGSAGGNARLDVASSISSITGTTPAQPGEVLIQSRVRGWDPETRQLNLSDCSVNVQRRMTQGTSTTSTSDRLTTDLSIREGETTVLGSIGSQQMFIALTVTMIE